MKVTFMMDIAPDHPRMWILDLGGEWSRSFRDIDAMELEVCAPIDAPTT